jgi:hypothetical protein
MAPSRSSSPTQGLSEGLAKVADKQYIVPLN